MHTRAVILAGGEGTRLGVLTAKRTKPAVPLQGNIALTIFRFPIVSTPRSSM
jgi:glucose-1-phosphate adenylyltransferase